MRAEPIIATTLLLLSAGSGRAETVKGPVAAPSPASAAPLATPGPPAARTAVPPALAAASPAASPARPTGALHPDDLPRLRLVMRGVLYRSGSPSETALEQLCRNRWQRVYSLYGDRTTMRGPRNNAMAEHGFDERRCTTRAGEHKLTWQPALAAARNRTLPIIFRDIQATVREPARGPVLVHCWNGLHSAGMIAAMALRQFCGLSPEDGAAYWLATTSHASAYPYMVDHIRDFRPLAGFSLTADERRRVCPDMSRPAEWRTALSTLPENAAAARSASAPAAAAPPPAARTPVGLSATHMATGAANPAASSLSLQR